MQPPPVPEEIVNQMGFLAPERKFAQPPSAAKVANQMEIQPMELRNI